MGGTDTKIGLVDVNQQLLTSTVIPTEAETGAEAVIKRIGEAVLALMEQEQIAMDQCIGVGVGVPGTVDRKAGMVVYSNNIKWEQVPMVSMLSAYLPVPIQIANDADCAALGEAVSGAAKDYQDVVMLTLGTGVGGGIILDGKIYEGGRMGGCELGHMVIVENGEPCTCGRKGCLEAYASATALRRVSEKKLGKSMEPAEIFALAESGDETAKEIVEDYTRKLGTGIVNIVNIFRPQALLLGGGIAAQGEKLLAPVREMVKTGCFGGVHGEIPEIKAAKLGNQAGMIGAANLV
ncbi:MAG: ROK family protein [Lachnospiraceae bacterium]|nr:ROK family protein [Lachnospiraceae bacterium]